MLLVICKGTLVTTYLAVSSVSYIEPFSRSLRSLSSVAESKTDLLPTLERELLKIFIVELIH